MAISAQDRLNRLLPNRPKPSNSDTHSLHSSEQELLEYKQRQQKATELPPDQIDQDQRLPADEVPQTNAKPTNNSSQGRPNAQPQQGHLPGTDPEQAVFLPGGVWRGGLAATQIEDGGKERYLEPISSSHDRIGHFCIWSLVAKFPYKYMQDPGDKVSRRFFANEKIFQRNWHLHYIFAPESCAFKPIILVPFSQVETLVHEISTEFNLHVQVPSYPFQLSFYKDGMPRPQSLGTFNSKNDMADLQSTIPDPPASYNQLAPGATPLQIQDYEAWQQKMERACEAEKNKKSGNKKKTQQKRDITVMENANQLQRAQRYLGVKQKLPTTELIRPTDGGNQEHLQSAKDTFLFPEALNVDQPAPFSFEDQTVIVAIDVESWEMDHNIITEIGVSTLDTRDLANLAPGQQGEEWIKKIRSRHFRIKGREALRNFKFCNGNPDMFQFGTSEFVAIDEAAEAVDSCFEFPYSTGFGCEGPPGVDAEGLPLQRNPAVLDTTQKDDADDARNLLLLGHDIDGDIAYLSTLGSFIFGSGSTMSSPERNLSRRHKILSSIRERLDTTILYKSLSKDDQVKSLVKLCHELDITAWYAHNAGNDARYTLEAFVKLVIKSRLADDGANAVARNAGKIDVEKTLREIEAEQRINSKLEAARQQIESELATHDNTGAPGLRRRSPSPFFAQKKTLENNDAVGSSDKITFDEATRRYLEKSGAPLTAQTEHRFDEGWGVSPTTDKLYSADHGKVVDGGSATKPFEQDIDRVYGPNEITKVKSSAEQKRSDGEMQAGSESGQESEEEYPY